MVIFAGKSNGYHNDLWKYVLGMSCSFFLSAKVDIESQKATAGKRSNPQMRRFQQGGMVTPRL